MADRFDHSENDRSGGRFVMGFVTGTVLGAGLGMLFAPKAGSALRDQLSEQADNLASTATKGYRKATDSAGQWVEEGRDAASALAEKGKDLYDRAGDAIKSGAGDAQRDGRDTARGVTVAPTPAAARSSEPIGASGSEYHYGGSHSSGINKEHL
jgi:gas vesicle protein